MLNPLQENLLEMFAWLTKYLNDQKLSYYVIGGTFLGAVRHEGFIPWDDDIDIAMPRPDYEKLIKLLEYPVDNYIVESPKGNAKDYIYAFSKFYDLNTTMTEKLRKNITRGVFIDIFPLDGIGNNYRESLKNYKKIDRLNMLLAMKVCAYRKDRVWWKNFAVFLGRFLPVSSKKLAKKIDTLCAEKAFEDSQYVGNLISTYRAKELMEKTIFGKPVSYKFENLTVFGPEKYDEYLTRLYGDWKKLPPVDKRHSAHNFLELDLNKQYNYKCLK